MTQATYHQENVERQLAYDRVQQSELLKPYTGILFDSLLADEPDWQWVATAPEHEVAAWAEDMHFEQEGAATPEEVTSERDEDWQ